MLKPTFENLPGTRLAGQRLRMSIATNRTQELWQNFMPGVRNIKGRIAPDYYSIEVYDGLDYFKAFDPYRTFEKWAAVRVGTEVQQPDGIEHLLVPEGLYAVFPYKAKMCPAPEFYRQIFAEWLPASAYRLENRPHMAVMGPEYSVDNPDSLEHIWIPVAEK